MGDGDSEDRQGIAAEESGVIPIYVGYDPREAIAYHTFCQEVQQICGG